MIEDVEFFALVIFIGLPLAKYYYRNEKKKEEEGWVEGDHHVHDEIEISEQVACHVMSPIGVSDFLLSL